MSRIVNSRCVLAVRDLEVSTRYYKEVLGFSQDPIDADGWSFLTRDTFRVMLGECANEKLLLCDGDLAIDAKSSHHSPQADQ